MTVNGYQRLLDYLIRVENDINIIKITAGDLRRIIFGNEEGNDDSSEVFTTTPKISLLNFDYNSFKEYILTNLLSVGELKEAQWEIDDLLQLKYEFESVECFKSNFEASNLKNLELFMTYLVHLSKHYTERKNESQLIYFLNNFRRHKQILSVKLKRRIETTFVTSVFSNPIFLTILAKYFSFIFRCCSTFFDSSGRRGFDYSESTLLNLLKNLIIYQIKVKNGVLGYCCLEGFVVNYSRLAEFDGLPVVFKTIYLLTLCFHEVGHFLIRKIFVDGDLNYSTPSTFAYHEPQNQLPSTSTSSADQPSGTIAISETPVVLSNIAAKFRKVKSLLGDDDSSKTLPKKKRRRRCSSSDSSSSSLLFSALSSIGEFGRFNEIKFFGARVRWLRIIRLQPEDYNRFIGIATAVVEKLTLSSSPLLLSFPIKFCFDYNKSIVTDANDSKYSLFSPDEIKLFESVDLLESEEDSKRLCFVFDYGGNAIDDDSLDSEFEF